MHRSVKRGVLFALSVLAAPVLGCATSVDVRPAAQALAPNVDTVVGLPISLGFGGDSELRRIQRRTSDILIADSGGHAVIAEELITGEDDHAVMGSLRALGEDPARTITLGLSVGLGGRLVPGASPIPGFIVGNHLIIDYHAHIDVRRAGSKELIGTVEVVDSGAPNDSEVGADGKKHAAMRAIEAAMAKAIATFAPRLVPYQLPFAIVEVPVEAASSVTRRLTALGTLYPELPIEAMQMMATTGERFFVIDPGALVVLGLARGDILGVPDGATSASRAALARAVVHGIPPALAVERGGQRYLLASIR
jgi:hypothetical protein